VCFLLLDVIVQTRIFMTDVCLTLHVLLLYEKKASANSLTVSRNDREKSFGLLMLKICVTLLNKLLYSK